MLANRTVSGLEDVEHDARGGTGTSKRRAEGGNLSSDNVVGLANSGVRQSQHRLKVIKSHSLL